jgi:hypothetical protein
MNKGLDQLPGHAYAPGLEPGWFDLVVRWEQTSSIGVIMPSLVFTAVMLLIAIRLLAARPRMRQTGVRRAQNNRPPETAERSASVAKIIAHTAIDPNFVNEDGHGRAGPLAKEGGV